MNKPVVPAVPVPKTLAEQKSDFTAEGSPPPGKVATSIPVASPDAQPEGPPAAVAPKPAATPAPRT